MGHDHRAQSQSLGGQHEIVRADRLGVRFQSGEMGANGSVKDGVGARVILLIREDLAKSRHARSKDGEVGAFGSPVLQFGKHHRRQPTVTEIRLQTRLDAPVLAPEIPGEDESYHLDFGQVGLITLTFQMTASILQPVVGAFTDRRPHPYSLACGMGCTLIGLVTLSRAGSFATILVAAGVIGLGSSVFHPEASRVARLASGGRHGFAQSLFQVGGNAGTSLGPLLAAALVVPYGQASVLWFAVIALAGIGILVSVGKWYARTLAERRARPAAGSAGTRGGLPRAKIVLAFGMAGIGSAVLGELADRTSLEFVFRVCGFLPLIGLLAAFLPNERGSRKPAPG